MEDLLKKEHGVKIFYYVQSFWGNVVDNSRLCGEMFVLNNKSKYILLVRVVENSYFCQYHIVFINITQFLSVFINITQSLSVSINIAQFFLMVG